MTWQNQCSRQFLDFIIYGLDKWFEIFTIRFDAKGEMIEMRSLQISNLCLFVWASNGRNRLIFLFIASPKSQNCCTIFALYRLSKLNNNLLSLFASFVVEENIFIIASSDTKQNGKWLDTFANSQSVVFQISAVLFYLPISLSILSFLRIRERARPVQINAATRLWIPLRMH